MHRRKCSGAEVIPNSNLRKQYRPNGVMKVVSNALSGDRGICQNPEFASNLVKTLAPANPANVCSTAGSGCLSRQTLLLSHVKINANPDFVVRFWHHYHSSAPLGWFTHLDYHSQLLHLLDLIFHLLHQRNGNSTLDCQSKGFCSLLEFYRILSFQLS